MKTILRQFQVLDSLQRTHTTVLVATDQGLEVLSNVDGVWRREMRCTDNDLYRPEYTLHEWDIKIIEPITITIDMLEDALNAPGGEAVFKPSEYPVHAEPGTTALKNRAWAEAKIQREYGGDASHLVDLMSSTILFDTVEKARAGASKFIGEHGEDVVRVKDRIYNPTDNGYRDILVNFKMKSGLIAEVLFNSRNMQQTKEVGDGRKLYEQMRAIPKPTNHQEAVTFDQRKAVLTSESKRAYDRAYRADGNGNWGK